MHGFYRRFLKRALDVTGAAIGLIALLPVMAVIAVVIRMQMGSPVIFKQRRPGLGGRAFTLYKFRTMTAEHDAEGNLLPNADRLTTLGRFLRKTSLDELPELWNVVIGDMSLVGPRPLRMEYLQHYSRDQARRHEVRPGITGLAQVNGRNLVSWNKRFELDVWYVDNYSLAMDLKILRSTVGHVLTMHGTTPADGDFMTPFGLRHDEGAPADRKDIVVE